MPMLCQTVDVVPQGDEWVLEPKLDGWRVIAHHLPARNARERQIAAAANDPSADHNVRLCARGGNDYTGQLPHIAEAIARSFPPDTVIDGELVGRSGWGDVQSAMTRHDFGITASGESAVEYVIFDVMRVDGTDARPLTWTQRRELLEKANFDDGICPLKLIETFEATARAHQVALSVGLEGTVCKRRDSKYASGTRSPAWVKCKPQTTCEAKIVGFKDGTGALAGLVGAFEVELLSNGAQTTVKCGTQERHEDATANPTRWLGAVIEIKHHGIGKSGKPRHPQFLRRRDDLTPASPRQRRASVAKPKAPRKDGSSGRNYGAMGDEKLLQCMRELSGGGDAYDRCVAKGAEPGADLALANNIARDRGLI